MPKRDVSIARYFADLPNPRIDWTKKHSLTDIQVVALRTVIAGADSWEEVEAFGGAKSDWLKRFPALPNGIPSHGTFYRMFARLDPVAFGECVAGRMGAACEATGLRHIAVGGKAVRAAPGTRSAGAATWSVRGRPGHARANSGLVRLVAASVLKQNPEKGSIKAKRLRAAWDDGFRLQVLRGCADN